MKIRPVGAKLFHADGRTDMMKLIIVFRNFADAPKNYWPLKVSYSDYLQLYSHSSFQTHIRPRHIINRNSLQIFWYTLLLQTEQSV